MSGRGSLYVGDLDPEVNEALLFETFKDVGAVLSIRVCRDAVTRRSLGYAYVNFQNPEDAKNCIDQYNFTRLKGRPCRIMWSQRNPALRKSNKGNIFIRNLDPAIDNKALYDTFSAFGPILSCKVVTNDKGESLGYGFVHFESEESATQAIDKVNGMLLNRQQVFVGPFQRREKRIREDEEKFKNIYVKHLRPDLKEEELQEAFSKFGEITSCALAKREDGTCKGFGYVNYKEHEEAKAAIAELHDRDSTLTNLVAEGKTLYVARHQKKAERHHLREQSIKERQMKLAKFVNLYVKNLDDNVDDEKLRELFSQFGEVVSAAVMVDENKLSKGFGFVSFKEPEAANKALELNGHLGISSKPLYVALAQRKEERRMQLEQQFMQNRAMQVMQQRRPMPGPQNLPGNFPPYGANPQAAYPHTNPIPMPQNAGMYPQRGVPPAQPRWAAVMGGAGPPGGPRSAAPYNMYGVQGQQPQLPRRPAGRGAPGVGPAGRGLGMAGPGRGIGGVPGAPKPPQAGLPAQPGLRIPGAEPLTAVDLAAMSEENQKNALGERLFSSISQMCPTLAAKITGMLLEMDNAEILNLLESPELLRSKVQEAIQVLHQHPEEMKMERP